MGAEIRFDIAVIVLLVEEGRKEVHKIKGRKEGERRKVDEDEGRSERDEGGREKKGMRRTTARREA